MKKLIISLLVFAISLTAMFSMIACNNKADYESIQKSGEMVIGITMAPPMNFNDDSGNLIGFDTEFARVVCEKLGVKAKFQVIKWDKKETELKGRTIDCIWNGLTVTEERKIDMDFSVNYMKNNQSVVINKANAAIYTNADSLKGVMISAEKGSAGESAIASIGIDIKSNKYTGADDQIAALHQLSTGLVDVAVIDSTTAGYQLVNGAANSNLMIVDTISIAADEFYAIGFRKSSDLTQKVNAIIAELIADGALTRIATKYGLEQLLVK